MRAEGLQVIFGASEITTFKAAQMHDWLGVLHPLGSGARRKVTHPHRGPTADAEEKASDSALRLADRLSMPPPAPACGSTKRLCPRRLLVGRGSGDHQALSWNDSEFHCQTGFQTEESSALSNGQWCHRGLHRGDVLGIVSLIRLTGHTT